jgi:hypothetical protein
VGLLHCHSPHGLPGTRIEFCSAFHAYYIPAGVIRRKHQEFMDLK